MVNVGKYTGLTDAMGLRMMELHVINIFGVEKSSGTIAGSLFFPEIHIPSFLGQHIFVGPP